MSALNGLEPKKVFEYFEMISSVPHGSNNTTQISNLCCNFAKHRGLKHYCDELGNVIIYKEASCGYEAHDTVIIQGHMDMVAVKTPDCGIDLENEGLKLKTDGKYIWAEGTSLGADDGIAVAMAMAVLDSDSIEHPPVEVVFTINEETGMDGAQFLDASFLHGKTMLNIDSEAEGVITCGCAGGMHALAEYTLDAQKTERFCVELQIDGLAGGHSGNEIHKNRANSNILMLKLLADINGSVVFRLVSIDGGEKDNAIANSTRAVIAISESDFETVLSVVDGFFKRSLEQYKTTDPELSIRVNEFGNRCVFASDEEMTDKIISALSVVPNGVQTMSGDIEGLVESSLNLGVVKTRNNTVSLSFCLRSSAAAEMLNIRNKLLKIVKMSDGKIRFDGE